MTQNELKFLEQKIDQLISLSKRLQQENNNLRDRESALLKERSQLLEKNEMARNRVETMISRLKNLNEGTA